MEACKPWLYFVAMTSGNILCVTSLVVVIKSYCSSCIRKNDWYKASKISYCNCCSLSQWSAKCQPFCPPLLHTSTLLMQSGRKRIIGGREVDAVECPLWICCLMASVGSINGQTFTDMMLIIFGTNLRPSSILPLLWISHTKNRHAVTGGR